VRQLNGFRRRRGSGGEQHHGHRVRVGELRSRLGRLGRLDELAGADDLLARVAHHVAVLVVHNDEGVGQPLDQRAQPVGAEPVVQRGDRDVSARRGE